MSRRIAVRAAGLTIAATGLFMLAAPANAAPAPDGSYQQTCRNVSASSGTLTAECRTRSGNWIATQLSGYRRCSGDIANNNGALVCERDDAGSGNGGHAADENRGGGNDHTTHGGHSDRGTGNSDRGDEFDHSDISVTNYPPGKYRETCRNIHTTGNELIAECRTWDGEWHRSKLADYRRCGEHIVNDDARLRCGEGMHGDGEHGDRDRDNSRRGGGDEERWGRITLFEHARFHGNQHAYGADAADLGPMSDRASSASVSGGSWQLCTRRNFRGRCVTINDSVRDFADIGLNDRVESIRRVK